MTLYRFNGADALSDFRLQRLHRQLAVHAPALQRLRARQLFLVDADATVDAEALKRLLDVADAPLPVAALTLAVVPRLGTLSPWSSKATDIARVCGLAGVRRLEHATVFLFDGIDALPAAAEAVLHDPMTESVITDLAGLDVVFEQVSPRPLRRVPLRDGGVAALVAANRDWGLALSSQEIDYLAAYFAEVGRDPTDAELTMFAQINSEHCRHKIFNAAFELDGESQTRSLFEMIKLTYAAAPQGVLSAYKDNAAVVAGPQAMRWFTDADHIWRRHQEPVHLLMKVETHNHPTGISPNPGAATGAGGEIRDEAATGRGGKPKAGLAGFAVSNLRIPGFAQPWEQGRGADFGRPAHMASALQIMLEAPIGAAAYSNEFGRPVLAGYFRSFEAQLDDGRLRGYHKPVMLAGGYGNIRDSHVDKRPVPVGARLVVLGGPAMLIGLGGGAASSMATGSSAAALDFASVQRANPELERRCQEVIDACWALGDDNPILSIHDVGAGGLSNALPELVDADGRGGRIRLRDVHSADPSLSPMEIWCNESQERYVLAVAPADVAVLERLCARERCPWAVVGEATAEPQLAVQADAVPAVDMPMSVLFGKAPRLQRQARHQPLSMAALNPAGIDIAEAAERVLRLPAVADKSFLITIGDRTVGGLTVRDQMVGPWQVPVADCAVTASGFEATTGEAMAMGERPLLALTDAAASARMAVGEALTNLAAARIGTLADVRLSANWMAAAGSDDEDARLYDAVRAVGAELCPRLGLAIPVGKDSLSMRTQWSVDGETRRQTSPLTLNIAAFAPVLDVRASLTPQLRMDAGASHLLLVDLGDGRNRLGGSALAQVYGLLGGAVPDVDDPEHLRAAFDVLQSLNHEGRVLAYHDRSDGGLFASLCEMAFAGHCGLQITLDALGEEPLAALFNEELGLLLQVTAADLATVRERFAQHGLRVVDVGQPQAGDVLLFQHGGRERYRASRAALHRLWAETSYRMAALRDHPDCAAEAHAALGAADDPGLSLHLRFDAERAPVILQRRPPVAILREQGVNGQAEMAYAFEAAGFTPHDVHMSDVLNGDKTLEDYVGVVACGGFSYGDTLGAGQGWARSILFNTRARDQFQTFLAHPDRFALGVCNGCQMFAALKHIVPGAGHWPVFRRNHSEQFEARWTMVEVLQSRSVLFAGMAGSRLPIVVSHGEGRAAFSGPGDLAALRDAGQLSLRYIDNAGNVARRYPANPNGSPEGITSLCNDDGRVTIMMPHPERTISGVTGSWWPRRFDQHTPWIQVFRNARRWVG